MIHETIAFIPFVEDRLSAAIGDQLERVLGVEANVCLPIVGGLEFGRT